MMVMMITVYNYDGSFTLDNRSQSMFILDTGVPYTIMWFSIWQLCNHSLNVIAYFFVQKCCSRALGSRAEEERGSANEGCGV